MDFGTLLAEQAAPGLKRKGTVIVVTMDNREASRARRYLSQQIPPVRGQLYELLQSLIEDRLTTRSLGPILILIC